MPNDYGNHRPIGQTINKIVDTALASVESVTRVSTATIDRVTGVVVREIKKPRKGIRIRRR